MAKQKIWLSIAGMVVGVVAAGPLGAVTITNLNLGTLTSPITSAGMLADQGTVLEAAFSLPSAAKLSIYTDSYGGGTNADMTTASAGGFMTSLVLYNAAGNYVAGETFPFGNTDPQTTLAGDASIQSGMLMAGTYVLTVSDWEVQQPVTATNLSDGFINYGSGTVFSDVQGNIRTGSYSVNLSPVSSSSATPEPATFWLMIPALGGVVALVRKRKSVRS